MTKSMLKVNAALKLLFCFLVAGLIGGCSASNSGIANKNEFILESPDKGIAVKFHVSDDQKAYYSISHHDTLVLDKSKLGVVMENADFTQGLVLLDASAVEVVTDKYEMAHGKQRERNYTANKQVFHLKNASDKSIDIIFQVSNDGVAFRYYFPEKSSEKQKIRSELTSFNFPDEARAWLQPMSKAKTGWSETNPSYEEYYLKDVPVGTSSPIGQGWVYPALFKSKNSWLLITESALDGNYCGTHLSEEAAGGEYSVAFPQAEEFFPGGALNPESTMPWYTPWRVITIGALKTIVESTLGTDLAKPAIAMDKSFIKPGKASWSWVILKDDSTVYNVQKRFIDYAAAMNWRYCLIDADWDRKIGYEKVKELADYAAKKDVGLLLWYNSSGSWNSTPYTPKSKLLTHEDRVKVFSRLAEMGIKGVKVDFFGGDGQSMIQYYLDILNDAADHKLLVNFHGSTLPRGWHRTYPNLMTMEAIKGFEFITFEQANADEAPAHGAMLPFTRNAFDPMDFTPLSLHKVPRINRKTSNGYELALPVLFLSGIQHYAETPEGMSHVPEYVKTYLQEVPALWEETKFVEGYPGKLAVIARRTGDKWYVAGINGEQNQKKISLDLSFIGNKEGVLLTDGSEAAPFAKESVTLANGKAEVNMRENGGFVMIF